ncbi:hypothetical protein [Bradyrhizobium sp. AC87j1]|uniref:hypothetical protein n=1 Tax=Bradyrhizobium sp. AC87j1 TaxID=2055894 RepID=UPI0011B0AA60|nr:hypothetical protein [Bradyrhizobium sp. AC87j1]
MPTVEILGASSTEAVPTSFHGAFDPKPRLEITPQQLVGTDQILLTTAYTWACKLTSNLSTTPSLSFDRDKCTLVSKPIFFLGGPPGGEAKGDTRSAQHWRRTYDGIVSSQAIASQSHRERLLILRQGENKNEKMGDRFVKNTVNDDVSPTVCFSGAVDGAYRDCWSAYNAFINGSIITLQGHSKRKWLARDLGPVLWPAMGYLVGGKKSSNGVRSPNSIVHQGFVYVFYNDTSRGTEDGRKGGMRLARADLADPTLTFYPLYKGAFLLDNPSLPRAFDPARMREFYGMPGGRADSFLRNDVNLWKFNVARVRGTDYFLGVSEEGGFNGVPWTLQLRVSSDLIHWSDPVGVPGEMAESWTTGGLHYPVLRADAGEAQEIDPSGFWLFGTGSRTGLVRKKLVIQLTHSRPN